MKIILFGCDGQVGWELQRSLAPLGQLVALGSEGGYGLCGNFTDPDGIARTLRAVRPDAIVNAAAYTAVDKAEDEPELAAQVNAATPSVIAQVAQEMGAWLVHYSTDYVFDGSGVRPWQESDRASPLNVYGRTKLEGEQQIARVHPRHLVLRTSWVYGARGGNFAKSILRLAGQRERLTVIDDQVGAPTGADLLADLTAQALRILASGGGQPGTYHVAAAGEASWNSYARFVLEQAQTLGHPLLAGLEQVDRVPTAAFSTRARRPLNSRLDTRAFRNTFHLVLPPWQLGVTRLIHEILAR